MINGTSDIALEGCDAYDLGQPSGIQRIILPGTALAVTTGCLLNGTILNEQIIVDTDRPWHVLNSAPASNQYDLESVETHEFGHAMGFQHMTDSCSGSSSYTMCPFVPIGTAYRRTPTEHDIHTMWGAYQGRPWNQ
jgi:hypothetical protein